MQFSYLDYITLCVHFMAFYLHVVVVPFVVMVVTLND